MKHIGRARPPHYNRWDWGEGGGGDMEGWWDREVGMDGERGGS